MLAAKEKTAALLPLAACGVSDEIASLPETRVWGSRLQNPFVIGAVSWLSSTTRWGCEYIYDETASVSLDQRYYASTYGRFLTADKKAGDPSDPVSMNRYTYTGGDPINRMDPKGNDWVLVGGQWCSTLDPNGGCYDPGYGGPDGGGSACASFDPNVAMALEETPQAPTFEAQLAAMGCGASSGEELTDNAAPPPDCDGLLASSIETFLSGKNSPLASFASWFVAVGMMDNIDPRLLVAMSGAESGYGTSSVATKYDNAFGSMVCQKTGKDTWNCHPRHFSSFGQSIGFTGDVVENQIYNKGNNTVGKLYSGQAGAYCVNQPGFPCSDGAGNVSSILTGLGGNPNSLGYPCPPPANPFE